ncbi:hypothetical protein, conserved [Eimeria brunetti]|uniref:Apple domain-containing protein n=1 Tax=Eimeria brunetti TaxID=51314 RepID=U6LNL3_9EIME|nr:hypothetical protein, conserved [Eimeria brunetti]
MRQLQRVAALAGLGVAVWPHEVRGWLAPNRRHTGSNGSFDVPLSMVETQWGSPYTEVPMLKATEEALDFFFSSLIGDSEEDLTAIANGEEHTIDEAIEGEDIVIKEPEEAADNEPVDKEPFTCNERGYIAAKDSAIMTITGLETPEECQSFCGQVHNCVAGVLQGADCILLSSLRDLKQQESVYVSPQGCDESCFKRGHKLAGEGTPLGTAPNPYICQSMCRGAEGCIGFSWDRKSLSCTAHTTDQETIRAGSVTSGPRDLCSPNSKPADYAGARTIANLSGDGLNERRLEGIASLEACRRLCLLDDFCQWFTYNTADKICYEKRSVGAIVKIKQGDQTTSRLSDTSCFLKSVKFKDEAYNTSKKQYMQECVYACSTDKNCKRWTYNTGSKACSLFKTNGPASAEYHALNTWSGPKEGCAAEPLYLQHRAAPACSTRGVRYAAPTLEAPVAAESANACQALCQGTAGCEAFSFDLKGGLCYKHIAVAVTLKKNNYNFISGPRLCNCSISARKRYQGEPVDQPAPSGLFFETPEECQLMCQATQNCSFFSFSNGSCEMVKSNGTASNNVAYTGGSKQCDGHCDMPGYQAPMRVYGYLKELKKKTKDECKAACKEDSRCTHYTHWAETGECYLKDAESLKLLEPKPNAYTGFTSCPICMNQGFGFEESDANLLWEVKAYTAEQCRWKCQNMPNCTFFNYSITTKRCALLTGKAERKLGADLVSGPEKCDPARSCFLRDTSFQGGKTIKRVDAVDGKECQLFCAREPLCMHFMFAAGQCTLLEGEVTTGPSEGWMSGPKKCYQMMSRCDENNIEYAGGDIRQITTKDAETCRVECSREPQCFIFTYNRENSNCWLKTIGAVAGRRAAGFKGVSGAKNGCIRWAEGKVYYRGVTIKEIKDLPSETSCYLQCQFHPKCVAFSYLVDQKLCSLKAEVFNPRVNSNSYAGPRDV